MTTLWTLVFLVALVLTSALWLFGPAVWTAWRRSRIQRRPFPPEWRRVLRRRMPAYARLPTDLQTQVRRQVQVLLAEVPFIGCAGLVVTDEMRVLIAAQAALLLLNRGAGGFSELRQVLVYPGPFVVDREDAGAGGLVHATRRTLSGESWQQGQVLLSWDDVVAGAADPDDGRNVVIHEFAHQLDQARGRANGAPWLGRREAYVGWAQVLSEEFSRLQQRLQAGEPGLLDPYAAADPAEFFAVVSEHFFEQPRALAAAHPRLYAEFTGCYRTDPRNW